MYIIFFCYIYLYMYILVEISTTEVMTRAAFGRPPKTSGTGPMRSGRPLAARQGPMYTSTDPACATSQFWEHHVADGVPRFVDICMYNSGNTIWRMVFLAPLTCCWNCCRRHFDVQFWEHHLADGFPRFVDVFMYNSGSTI